MEWLFKKMIENVGESYSPEQVKQILDHHQEILNVHQVAIERLLILVGVFSVLCVIYIIFTEIRFYKFQKKLENFQKK